MFRKLLYYFKYRKIIKKNEKLLLERHNLKLDYVNRLYTTISVIEEKREILDDYGYGYVDDIAKNYIANCNQTFKELGVINLMMLYDSVQLTKYDVGISFSYKYLNVKILYLIWYTLLSTLLLFGILFIFLNILYTSGITVFSLLLFYFIRKRILKKVNIINLLEKD